MKKQTKNHLIIALIFVLAAIIYTILVKFVDVKNVGPLNSAVGFASLNVMIYDTLPYNHLAHKLSDYISYASFVLVALFLIIGFIQLFKRKSLLKVDGNILALGILYVATGLTFLLFEVVKINYRPVLIGGELKASYPSSTTLLACVITVSAIDQIIRYIKNKKMRNIFVIILSIYGGYLVVGRLLCGAHWFSDILGGVIISIALLSLYYLLALLFNNHQKEKENAIEESKI